MNIAFLTPEYVTESTFDGGLANYLARVAEALTKKGHHVEIFTLSDRDETINHKGMMVHRIKIDGLLKKMLNTISRRKVRRSIDVMLMADKFNKKFRQRNKQVNFDIVQQSSYLSPGWRVAREKQIPVVTRVSSFTPAWRAASNQPTFLDDAIIDHLELITMRESQGVYAPSRLMGEMVQAYEAVTVDQIFPPYFNNGVQEDRQLFEEKIKNIDYLLFFGTMSEIKGTNFILKNIRKIMERNQDIHFIFIGKLIDKKKFDQAVGEYQPRVHYWDAMKKEQLIPFVKNAKAVILPSKLDNLPNTVLKSMSYGKVVITTKTSGFESIIESGKNGYLIDYGDDDQLCSTIHEICQQRKEVLEEIGRQARITIDDKFSADKNVDQLVAYYGRVIDNWKRKSGKR